MGRLGGGVAERFFTQQGGYCTPCWRIPYLAMLDSEEVMHSPLALLQDALADAWGLLGGKANTNNCKDGSSGI